MKKVIMIFLCILLDLAVISIFTTAFGSFGFSSNDEKNPEGTPAFTVVNPDIKDEVDNPPEGVYGGYSIKTADVKSGGGIEYVAEGTLYYTFTDTTTYYFIRYAVDDWDLYSIRYISHESGESFYPYFSDLLYSFDLITWNPLDHSCVDVNASVKEVIIENETLEYIDICVYAEAVSDNPRETLDRIAMHCEGYYPTLYITNVRG